MSDDQTLAGRQLNSVRHHTADYTLAAESNGTRHTNKGASGTVVINLPPAVAGLHYAFCVLAAHELRLNPDGTETISLPSTGVPGAAGKYLTADAVGEIVYLECFDAGNWEAVGTGTWTAEA